MSRSPGRFEMDGKGCAKAVTEPGTAIDVPKVLDDRQVRFFVEQGYLAVPDLIAPAEVEELRRDVVRLARGDYGGTGIPEVPEDATDDEVVGSILCIHQPHYLSPVMEKYVRHPKICGALSQIVAAHLPFWDGSV